VLARGNSIREYSDLLLGIDGGGSGTVALLARGGCPPQTIGRGIAGPTNPQAIGIAGMERALDDAIDSAFSAAGIPRAAVGAACLGLAGAGRPEDQKSVLDWAARQQLAGKVRIENDGRLVLAAGTPGDWGAAIIAGTGSLVLVRTPGGCLRRAGGWGYLFGDEGSAYALALAGLRALTRASDGSAPATAITAAMLARLQVTCVQGVVPAVYGRGLDRTAIAGLADVVTAAADKGDVVAMNCLETAATELAGTARAAMRELVHEGVAQVPVALAGGLLLACRPYANLVLQLTRQELGMALEPVTFVDEPAVGAIRLAHESIAGDPP
jgi:N-acetylglucosamine kinase-like BadF-type ATPase